MKDLGIVLCSVFIHAGEIVMRVGSTAWNLFEPGLKLEHRAGNFRWELSVLDANVERAVFRYRRKDFRLAIVDSTYDDLDFELANPRRCCSRWRAQLVEEWSARATRGRIP